MNAKNLIGGLVIGAIVGAAAGLLLAPASGERTMRKIGKGSLKLKKNLKQYVEGSVGALRDQFNEKRSNRLRDYILDDQELLVELRVTPVIAVSKVKV